MARIGEMLRTARVDGALQLVGHEVAAVGIGADGERLAFQIAQADGVAFAHISLERGLVLQGERPSAAP